MTIAAAFFKRDRLYLLLIIFILAVNTAIFLPLEKKGQGKKTDVSERVIGKEKMAEQLLLERENVEGMLHKNRPLAILFMLTSLLILAIIFLGILVDLLLLSFKLSRKKIEMATYKPHNISWNAWDVAKVVILFMFFGYCIIVIESLLAAPFPILKNNNFRMILNTSILDLLCAVFILQLTVGQYKEKLISLGISFKNFFRNIFYGIVGYMAIIPILAGLLIITAIVIKLINYVPEREPVVELFLKEKDSAFLIYTSIFTSMLGPVIEEVFFRGFMYNAFKKYIGIFWAVLLTSALFAGLHTNIVGFLPIMTLGILLAYLYEKTGTLVSSITVHTIHNLSMVLFVFLIRQIRS